MVARLQKRIKQKKSPEQLKQSDRKVRCTAAGGQRADGDVTRGRTPAALKKDLSVQTDDAPVRRDSEESAEGEVGV